MASRSCCAILFTVLAATAAAAQTPPPDAPASCAPQWTSWGAPLHAFGCKPGETCSDAAGTRIEVLHGDEASGVAIRDLDRRICPSRGLARFDVVYSHGKDFRYPDCYISWWWAQEFAAFAPGCYKRTLVLSIVRGAVTVRP